MWLANEDAFTFKSISVGSEFKPTKRNFLKKIATMFDPLGFLSPFVIKAKVFMQDIWNAGTEWDDLLSDDLARRIKLWFAKLDQLQEIRVPRSLQQKSKVVRKINLHTFVDASQVAYGAVVYVRIDKQCQCI